MKSKFCFALSAIAALTLSASVQAQSQGSWLVRGGIMQLAPQVTSGDLSAPSLPGAKTAVSNSTQLAGGVTYMWSNNLAIDLPLALPFKHDLYGAGTIAGVGKIGDRIDERWFVDGGITRTPLKTRNTLSTGQTLDITLNPIGISLGVGMRF